MWVYNMSWEWYFGNFIWIEISFHLMKEMGEDKCTEFMINIFDQLNFNLTAKLRKIAGAAIEIDDQINRHGFIKSQIHFRRKSIQPLFFLKCHFVSFCYFTTHVDGG